MLFTMSFSTMSFSKFPFRVLWLPALLAIPFVAGGCARDGSTLDALRDNPILRNAARAVLMGKIYDRISVARRNGDNEALIRAADELVNITRSPVEKLVAEAAQLDISADNSKSQSQSERLEKQAAEKYRQALRISPNFVSEDAYLLNALGYFLAERGSSQSDFQTAERLTREALKMLDDAIAQMEKSPIKTPLLANTQFSRSNTRDSLAWALFRRGQFQAAKTEQTKAIQEAEATAGQIREKVSADLYFHMGEIERALKNISAAEKNYRAALKAEPDHTETLSALAKIGKKPLVAPRKSAPQNPAPNDGLPNNKLPGEEFPEDGAEPENSPPENDLSGGALEARSTPVARHLHREL